MSVTSIHGDVDVDSRTIPNVLRTHLWPENLSRPLRANIIDETLTKPYPGRYPRLTNTKIPDPEPAAFDLSLIMFAKVVDYRTANLNEHFPKPVSDSHS